MSGVKVVRSVRGKEGRLGGRLGLRKGGEGKLRSSKYWLLVVVVVVM